MSAPPLPVLDLDPRDYPGGVGVWGSLAAIYDTTKMEPEHGVHVHARKVPGRKKDIDESFGVVNLVLGAAQVPIGELEAQAYVAAAVLDLPMVGIVCPYCSAPHLDEQRFAVHPHQSHLCHACNRTFLDRERSVGNPIMVAKKELGDALVNRATVPGRGPLRIDQSEEYAILSVGREFLPPCAFAVLDDKSAPATAEYYDFLSEETQATMPSRPSCPLTRRASLSSTIAFWRREEPLDGLWARREVLLAVGADRLVPGEEDGRVDVTRLVERLGKRLFSEALLERVRVSFEGFHRCQVLRGFDPFVGHTVEPTPDEVLVEALLYARPTREFLASSS